MQKLTEEGEERREERRAHAELSHSPQRCHEEQQTRLGKGTNFPPEPRWGSAAALAARLSSTQTGERCPESELFLRGFEWPKPEFT